MYRVDVIIRTLAQASRRKSLLRALASIRSQQGLHATALIVVNGSCFDPSLVNELAALGDVRLKRLDQASLIEAGRVGRSMVNAPYFTFLDDDDLFVENSLQHPATYLAENAACDAVITNIYRMNGKKRSLCRSTMRSVARAPQEALLEQSWLHPGAGMFRTATIEPEQFAFARPSMEWTSFAFRLLVSDRRIEFIDVPTVYYLDTPGSVSKGPFHQENALEVLAEIKRHPNTTPAARALASSKYTNTLHSLASMYWARGEYRKAWARHLASLRGRGFFRYVLFSRKLITTRR